MHPRLQTPVVATASVGVIGAVLLWLVPFYVQLIITSASLLITYLLVGLAALVGRLSGRTRRAAYGCPAGRWCPS